MQKAVISNSVGDVPLHITSGINGILIKNNDINAHINALKLLINNKELRKNYGIKARKTCQKYLETSICSNQQFEIFKKVIEN